MVFKVNGGIINHQTLTGGLRYFKMAGPFAWTISDGTVNLPVSVTGGSTPATSFFVVGNNKPVPNSAAEIAMSVLSKQCDITIMSCQPALYASTTEIHFACSSSAFGWGSDTPSYTTPPANAPEDLTAAATQMQVAIRAIPNTTVYVTTGGGVNDPLQVPVTATANFSSATVTEVPFKLV